MKHDADDAIARLLRDRLEQGQPAGPCLDAEMVAAWFEGTLTPAQQQQAESHASRCARCQGLLAAMAQTEPVAPPSRRSVSLVRWFAPALAAAAALLVWMNVPHRSVDLATAPAPEPAMKATAPGATATPQQKSTGRAAALDQPADELRAQSRKTLGAHAEAPPAAARTKKQDAAAAGAPAPFADRQAVSKDQPNAALQRDSLAASPPQVPVVRSDDGSLWRIAGDGTVSRSTDNGTTWRDQNLGSSARLLAGSSPLPNVVWFAGADGIVVMTIDGVSWQWRSLPERVDLTGIAAADGRTATVTTRDGRRFVTHDGGLTWVPAAVQENPAAPF